MSLRPEQTTFENWSQWITTQANASAGNAPKRRALLVSYEFPPVGGSGVQRAAKLAKYLPQFGWSVEVLTAAHERFPTQDETLLADLPADCRIHRVCGYEPACLARRIASPLRVVSPAARRWVEDRVYWRMAGYAARHGRGNGEGWWARPALRAAIALHRAQPFDAVISTGPPHFTHWIARELADRTGIPWVADVRDPLMSDFDRSMTPSQQQIAHNRIEQMIASDARSIITTTPALANDLQQRYQGRSNTIRCVMNGFDADDLRPLAQASQPANNDICTFIAAGAFYGKREIAKLIQPLDAVLAAHPEWAGRVRLVLAGTIDREQRRTLESNQPDWLTILGYVDHARALALAMQATCSITIVPDCQHGGLSIPAKTFEQIAMPRHILGLSPAGSDAAHVLKRAGAATCSQLESEAQVREAFEQIIASHFAGTLTHERKWADLQSYSRRNIAQLFAEVLNRAAMVKNENRAEQEVELILARMPMTSTSAARESSTASADASVLSPATRENDLLEIQ